MDLLPQLPDRVRRKIALQWEGLVEKHGFTGGHLNWIETRKLKMVSSAPPPPPTLGRRTVPSTPNPAIVRYLPARTGTAKPIYAPADGVGISETSLLAAERFAQLAEEYFCLWKVGADRRSDVFAAWLVEIRTVVAGEVAQLWKGRGDWFQRVCLASVDTTLTPIIEQWTRAARDIEILDLTGQQHRLNLAEAQEQIARLDAIAEGTPEPVLAQPASAASVDEAPEPVPEPPKTQRGPSADYETAARVAATVARIAGDAPWRPKLDDICFDLDEQKVPRPKTWKGKGYRDWFSCLSGERELIVKAIHHHLKLYKRASETFS
jgi:hypothetical protein